MDNIKKQHWETIYQTKQPNEVSWTQDVPATSLEFLHRLDPPKTAYEKITSRLPDRFRILYSAASRKK
jgi:hypothetical protein